MVVLGGGPFLMSEIPLCAAASVRPVLEPVSDQGAVLLLSKTSLRLAGVVCHFRMFVVRAFFCQCLSMTLLEGTVCSFCMFVFRVFCC